MCPFCHSTGIAKAVSAGQPYCGRSCGQNASAAGWVDGVDPAAVQAATSTGSVCRQCRQKPQQKGHPYCSKSCAKAYDQSHVWSAQLEKTATKGVKKYTIDDQLSSMSAMQTEDAAHFNTAYTQYGKLLQGQQKQVQKVEYYINPNLQANFDQKQAEFKVRAAFLLRECLERGQNGELHRAALDDLAEQRGLLGLHIRAVSVGSDQVLR